MSTSDVFVTIVVPANVAVAVRKVGEVLGSDTDGMFTTGLSASGAAPATHFISSGVIYPRFVSAIRSGDLIYSFVTERIAQNGKTFPYTLAQVKTAVASIDVSTDVPFDALARLGLSLVRTAIV